MTAAAIYVAESIVEIRQRRTIQMARRQAAADQIAAGVMQMRAPSYVSTLGRFISREHIEGGSASAYNYAYQDPINNQVPVSVVDSC